MSEQIKQDNSFFVKKLQIIMILSIISIIGIPFGGILFLFLPIMLAWLGWVVLSVFSIIPFILGILILATDWKNEEINNKKILWGILTLLLLGPIASLVFSVQSRKIYLYDDSIIVDVEDDDTEE